MLGEVGIMQEQWRGSEGTSCWSPLLHACSPFRCINPLRRHARDDYLISVIVQNLITNLILDHWKKAQVRMIPPDFFDVNGARIPARGLGTFQPNPEQYGPESVKQSVLTALKIGYRHIDTSLRYGDGQGEKEVGEAVRESGVPREEIFIVSKL